MTRSDLNRKMRLARGTLKRRFHDGNGKLYMGLLDQLILRTDRNPTPQLMLVASLRSVKAHGLTRSLKQPYGRVHYFQARHSKMKVRVESDVANRFMAPFHVILTADDRTGLLFKEIEEILEILHDPKLSLVELALDFSALSEVTDQFVRWYAVFGKVRRDRNPSNPNGDWWGTWKTGTRISSYFKFQVWAQRVEFKMRSRFLRQHGITGVTDFYKFVKLLPGHHILFGELD